MFEESWQKSVAELMKIRTVDGRCLLLKSAGIYYE